MRLNPYHPERFWFHLARAQFVARRYADAIEFAAAHERARRPCTTRCLRPATRSSAIRSMRPPVWPKCSGGSRTSRSVSTACRCSTTGATPTSVHHCEALRKAGLVRLRLRAGVEGRQGRLALLMQQKESHHFARRVGPCGIGEGSGDAAAGPCVPAAVHGPLLHHGKTVASQIESSSAAPSVRRALLHLSASAGRVRCSRFNTA